MEEGWRRGEEAEVCLSPLLLRTVSLVAPAPLPGSLEMTCSTLPSFGCGQNCTQETAVMEENKCEREGGNSGRVIT